MNSTSIARRWVVANFISLIITASLGLVGYFVRTTFSIDADRSSFAAQAAYVGMETASGALSFALYAWLTGSVLSSTIPALSQRAWVTFHLAVGLVFGFFGGHAFLQPSDNEPFDIGTELLILIFFVVLVAGGLLGAVFGGLQALILRHAAQGLPVWIGSTALAMMVLLLIAMSAYPLWLFESSLRSELVAVGIWLVGGTAAAIVMVPAVRRLRPRAA
jgi:hypothetical protein